MKKILFIILLFSAYLYGYENLELPDDELVQFANDGDPEAQFQLGLLLEELKYANNKQRLDYLDRDSFYWYELAAENEHSGAITKIALEYLSEFGHYKVKDLGKVIELLKRSSNSDNEAALFLSIMYYHGMGTEKNVEAAIGYFIDSQKDFYRLRPMIFLEKELVDMVRELSRKNDPYALFVLADFYYYGKTEYYEQNYKKAYRIYKKSAELNNMSSIFMVGLMNYNGIGVLKDLQESYTWILKAAEAGITPAINKAGIMNYFGEGTAINYEIAHSMFLVASEAGDSLSQYFLGVMYYKGEGSEKDRDLSKKWIKAAYENGSSSAKKFWETKELWK